EADGIIPRAECGHKRDLLAGEVIDNNPCQADDHQTQHENDVPLRSTLSIYFDWGTVCCGACASGCSSRRWVVLCFWHEPLSTFSRSCNRAIFILCDQTLPARTGRCLYASR